MWRIVVRWGREPPRGTLMMRLVRLWVDSPPFRHRGYLLRPRRQKNFLSLRLQFIRMLLAPVRLSHKVLLRALPRMAAPRGRVNGIRPVLNLGIGIAAVGVMGNTNALSFAPICSRMVLREDSGLVLTPSLFGNLICGRLVIAPSFLSTSAQNNHV